MNQMEFQRKFGTERQCREHLFGKRWPRGFACPRCGHGEYFDVQSRGASARDAATKRP
jgi:transcription elongation factor Elf1